MTATPPPARLTALRHRLAALFPVREAQDYGKPQGLGREMSGLCGK